MKFSKTYFRIITLFFAVIVLNSCCPYRQSSSPKIDASDYMIYYVLNSEERQTLQFQACESLFYSVTGKFDSTVEEDSITINSIDFQAMILKGFGSFSDKGLKIREVKHKYYEKDSSLIFNFDLQLTEKHDSDYPSFSYQVNERVMDGVSIDFLPISKDDNLAKYCGLDQDFIEMEEYKELELERFTGGGYECNGRAVFRKAN